MLPQNQHLANVSLAATLLLPSDDAWRAFLAEQVGWLGFDQILDWGTLGSLFTGPRWCPIAGHADRKPCWSVLHTHLPAAAPTLS